MTAPAIQRTVRRRVSVAACVIVAVVVVAPPGADSAIQMSPTPMAISAVQAAGDSRPPGSADSPFTMNVPMTTSDSARIRTCRQTAARDSPFCSRRSIASGIDMPVMKRNAGNTTSVMVMPSVLPETWRRNAGVPVTPAMSFTNSISSTSRPRSRSRDCTRA